MARIEELVQTLARLQEEFGRFTFEQAMKSIKRRKLLIDVRQREKRKKYPWSKCRMLYRLQRGICPLCREPMVLLRGKIELDHRDPNAADFNNERNLQVVHRKCNRSKSSKSLYAVAKMKHRTVVQLLC